NSARDLLAVLQPATKALAQVLAGRSNASGQLAHAQAVLAHAERLIGERAHNRLNPHEREEFFEQLARLRLTLSDAEAEAEVVAAEEQEPRPVAPPVDQERLRALALALSTPAASREQPVEPAAPEQVAPAMDAAPAGEVVDTPAEADAPAAESKVSAANARSGRLQLSRNGDEAQVPPPAVHQVRRTRQRPRPASKPAEAAQAPSTPAQATAASNGHGAVAPEPQAIPANGGEAPPAAAPVAGLEEDKPRKRTRRRKTVAGVPEGWVIDEEGFVVPGPQ
ncbi:MAG: hypothetical protein R3349_01585, partial [Geminicoccaceae bacterium]|nr:hypothetical protein [Geminicoccaceae bacterium]